MFFFFKQKTAYEIRKGDWSSDVCSSDLGGAAAHLLPWLDSRGRRHDEPSPAPGIGETRPAPLVGASLWPVSRRARATARRASEGAPGGPRHGGAHGIRQALRDNRSRVVPGVPGARAA